MAGETGELQDLTSRLKETKASFRPSCRAAAAQEAALLHPRTPPSAFPTKDRALPTVRRSTMASSSSLSARIRCSTAPETLGAET